MMKATTEATKLNFMTDHGSTRARVSIACRFAARRTCGRFGSRARSARSVARSALRLRQELATELNRPPAARVRAEAAADGNPPVGAWPLAEVVGSAGAGVAVVAGAAAG